MARPVARSWMVVAVLAASVCALFPSAATADVSRTQAARKALTALDARKGSDALVVFGLRTPVRAGALVTQAGPGQRERSAGVVRGRLARAGVKAIRPAEVLSVDAPSWLFYADQGPNQSFEHPGRVVLVERATGKVRISEELRWLPLVDGKRPAFFRSAAAYQSKRYRVLDRPYTEKRAATAKAASVSPAAKAAQQRLADSLAAQRSCALRVSDSLGDFYDFGRVDKTRAALGRLLRSLSQLNPGFVTEWYRPTSGRTPLEAAQKLIDGGCRDLFLYVAGGSTAGGDMVVGLRSSTRRALQWHVVDIAAIEKLVKANGKTTFKLAFDVPFGGKVAETLKDEQNVSVLLTAGGKSEPSFSYLPQILGPNGLERNTQNPFQLLEFTNTLIKGFERFVTDPEEIDHAIAEQAAGRSDSVMAWSLARSLELGPSPFSTYVLGTRTAQRVPSTTPAHSAINHAPVATTPPQFTREDTAENVALTAFDLDRDPLTFTVLAPPAHGTLTGTAPFLRYTPERDFFGVDQLTYRVSDGRGGTDTATVTIVVSPDNDLPSIIVGPSGTPPVFTENGGPVVVDGQLTIFDIDSAQLTGARVDIPSGFVPGDVLAFTPTAGITGTYDAATGVLKLSGTASVTAYRNALRSVTFGSTSDDPGTARTIRLRADDADENGIAASRSVTVVPSNDAPALVLPGAQTTAEDAPLALTGVEFTDPDAGTGPVEVALAVTHGTLSLGTTSGLTFTSGDGTADAALTFRGAPSAVNAALATLTFTPAADDTGAALLTVDTSDLGHTGGAPLTDSGTVAITVTATDDTPVNTVPGAQTLTEDVEGTLTGTFAVSDTDSTSLTTTLTLPDGTLGIVAAGSAIVTGHGTSTVQVTGTAADITDTLATVKAQGGPDVAGARTLTVATTDGTTTDTDTVAITITAVNDAPQISRPAGTQTTAEDAPLTFTSTLNVADVDAGTADVEATLGVAHGTLATGPTLAGLTVTGNGTAALTLTGTIGEINDALDGLAYTPAAEYAGADTLSFDLSDLGHTGTGGTLTDHDDIALDVTAANDAPALTPTSGAVAYTEGDAPTLVDDQLALVDVDDTQLTGASVTIGGHRSGDALTVTAPAGVTDAYDAGTGVLTLTGGADVADYRAALRTVRFASTSDDPGTSRTITFAATDGDDEGTATRGIAITPVNDAPAVSGPASATTDEDDEEALTLVVSDPDGTSVDIDVSAAHGTLTLATTDDLASHTGDGTGTVQLSGTTDAVSTALDGLVYTPAAEYSGADTIAASVEDPQGATGTHDVAVTVTALNDRPLVTTSAGATAWTEGTAPVAIDGALTVADVDDDDLEGATVTIAAGAHTGDRLVYADDAALTETYDAGTRTLTISGTAPKAAYQAYLRTVRYESTSGAPTGDDRAIEFVAIDGALASTAATKTVEVTEVNSAPIVTTTAGDAAFTEDGGPVAIDGGLTVTDADSPTLAGATVQLTGAYEQGDDTLEYTTTNGITGTFAAATGTLTLTGTKTVAEYEQALRTVALNSTSETATATRTVTFRVDDGADLSAAATRDVTFTAVNDKPVVTTTAGTVAFSEGGSAVVVDGAVDVTDVDSVSLASATVTVVSPRAGDVLAADTTGTTIAANFSAGVLTLSGTASLTDYRTVLRTVTFGTPSATPGASRTIAFRADDGAALNHESDAATRTVAISQLNDAPVLTATAGTADYAEDAAAVAVDPALGVADPDSDDLTGATVSIAGTFHAGDELAAPARGNITATFDPATHVLTATGADDVATYEAFLRDVTFRTTSDTPDTGARTISFQTTDDAGDESNVAERDVTVTAVNDAPVATVPSTRTVVEDASVALTGANAISVADVDASALQVRLTAPDGRLTLPDTTDLTFTEGDGTSDAAMTFTAPTATLNARLDGLTFAPAADHDTATSIGVVVDDQGQTGSGGARTDSETVAVTVTPVNDAPALAQPDGALTYTENDPATAAAPSLTATDIDDADLDSATVALTGATAGDALEFTDQNGITGAYDGGTRVLTLSGAAAKADYQAALRSVRYVSTSDDPGAATRTLTYRVSDGDEQSAAVTRDITVVPVNDDPDPQTDAVTAVGNTALVVDDPTDGAPGTSAVARKSVSGDILANDTDAEGDTLSITPATTTSADGGTVTIEADGDFVYESDPADSCDDASDSFAYTVTDGNGGTAQGTVDVTISGCVWYVSSDAAGNSGTSTAPFDTVTQARDASGTNDTVFLLQGDGTAYDTGTGYQLDAGERLIGELSGLSVGGSTLAAAAPGKRPKLTASAVRVIQLDDGNTLRGLHIDPSGAGGGGIFGMTGDVAGTLDDLVVEDTATTGNQPALDLAATTGQWDVTNLAVTYNSNVPAIRLTSAGTVEFGGTTIVNNAGMALQAQNTNMGTSRFDEITTNGGGIWLNGTTGVTNFGDGVGIDLNLNVNGSCSSLFRINNAGTINVNELGSDTVTATGCPAMNVANTAGTVDFDRVTSTNNPGGVAVWLTNPPTFRAGPTSSVTGSGGQALDIGEGSNDITWEGAINDGSSATTVWVKKRTGGTTRITGPITDGADAGGGVIIDQNTGGTIELSGATKTFDTGATSAIAMTNNAGATVKFTGGGLVATTTTARAFSATGGGSVAVTGTGNRALSTTGGAVAIQSTTIHDDDVRFEKVTSNGATNGIVLDTTGNAGGSFTVTGTGTACTSNGTCTGGALVNSTGVGALLTNVPGGVTLTRVAIDSSDDDGIRATSVANGLALDTARLTSNGDAAQERGIDATNVTGQSAITATSIAASFGDNVRFDNTTGTADLNVTNSLFEWAGGDGIQLRGDGTATMKADLSGATMQMNFDDGLQLLTSGTTTATMNLNMTASVLRGGSNQVAAGALVTISPAGDATTKVHLDDNGLDTSKGSGLILNPAGTSQFDAIVTANTVLNSGGVGIWAKPRQSAQSRIQLTGNTVDGYKGNGLYLSQGEGDGNGDFVVTNNTVRDPGVGASEALVLDAGSLSSDTVDVCADLSGNTLTSGSNAGGTQVAYQRYTNSQLRMPGFTGTMASYLEDRNPGVTNVTNWGSLEPTATGACTAPTAPPAP